MAGSPEAAEAAAFVQQLVARGITQKTIGQAIGRNDSLISQIRRGTGKGASLRDRLGELVANAERLGLGRGAAPEELAAGGAEPARRTDRKGRRARVRRAVTVRYQGGGGTSTVKQQAAQAGGGGLLPELQEAARDGLNVAFDVTFAHRAKSRVDVLADSGRIKAKPTKRRGHHRRGHTVTIAGADAADALAEIQAAGSFTEGVLAMMEDAGLISIDGGPAAGVGEVLAVEMRTW